VFACRLYGQRQALNAQVLHGMQPTLFTPAAGDDGATAAAKVQFGHPACLGLAVSQ
jgi:hypothetical protein